MDPAWGRKVLAAVTVFLGVVSLSVMVVAVVVCLVSAREAGRQPDSEAQKFKEAIDKKTADALKHTGTSFNADVPDWTFLNLLKPMASLHGLLPFNLSDIQGGRITVRNWVTTDGLKKSEILNGMKYVRGGIIVPVSGSYRVTVHALMHYKGPEGHCKNTSLDVIRHSAVTQKDDVMFRDKGEICPETNERASDYSSHLEGLLESNPGDQIFVVVSDLSLLMAYRDDHYFQVYLI